MTSHNAMQRSSFHMRISRQRPFNLLLPVMLLLAVGLPSIITVVSNTREAHAATHDYFYAAPWGAPGGKGDWASPWDLQTAFSRSDTIHPGDTLYLRGGVYTNAKGYNISLSGKESTPITITSYPGEWAIIDRASSQEDKATGVVTLLQGTQYVYLRNIEITNSDGNRVASCAGSNPSCYNRPAGVKVLGPHNKLINLVVHDNGNGIAIDNDQATGTTIYGCVIYNNGWWGPDTERAHGHGVYSQNANEQAPQQILDNIIFNNFETGIKVYAEGGQIQGHTITGNMLSANGTLPSPGGTSPDGRNMLMGSTVPSNALRALKVTNNYAFQLRQGGTDNVDLGYSAANNNDATFQNNVLLGGNGVLNVGAFADFLTVDHNKLIALNSDHNRWLVNVYPKATTLNPRTMAWDYNDYYSINADARYQNQFRYGNTGVKFSEWQQTPGRPYDQHGTYTTGLPAENWVYVRPDALSDNRANIITFNFTGASTVSVSLDGTIPNNYRYNVYNAYNPVCVFRPGCGPSAVASGTYQTGAPITIPLDASGQFVEQPVGWSGPPVRNGQPYVGIYIVNFYKPQYPCYSRLTFAL